MPKAHRAPVSPENLHALLLSTDRKCVDSLRSVLTTLGYRVRASRDIASAAFLKTWSDDSACGVGTVSTIPPRRNRRRRKSYRGQRSLRHGHTHF
jgi:hypothetical protein